MPHDVSHHRTAAFGPFRLVAVERLLLDGDRPMRLGSRALDILIALVERPGELVTKRDLMTIVWPDTTVVEANLTVHVAALRRALGDDHDGNRYIANIPGRGYRFVAAVNFIDRERTPSPRLAAKEASDNLPFPQTRLVGRDETIANLLCQLTAQRLVTIAGPGGIGKTMLALKIGEALIPAYDDGVWLVDLAPVADPLRVPGALASVLKLDIRSDDPAAGVVAAVRDRRMLLIFDNCEHVIDAAAALATGILRGSSGVKILATSREPLRVEGEHVHRLSGLPSPPGSSTLSAAAALDYPAVQLFVERAAASSGGFELTDADAPGAAEICRKLDGIPLAIEFAAARVDTFGVRGLVARLDDGLGLPNAGRRGAPARHQTIGAALDWSYQLLSPDEQMAFRRIAVFTDSFTLEAATAIVGNPGLEDGETIDHVIALTAKSLLATDVPGAAPRLRQFETTRAYALAKLIESGERDAIGRRHAEYYRDRLDAAGCDPASTDRSPE
jgi:predicted ATPase/DNA-binding winged helix-turn-helix (wHTH) protein